MRPTDARRRRTPVCMLVALAAVAVLTVACSAAAPAPPDPAAQVVLPETTMIAAARLQPGEAVPGPVGDAVVSVTGRIGTTNFGDSLAMDTGLLDQMGRVRVNVYEPWVKQALAFQGVWLADVLALAGADGSALSVHVTALDDYQIDLTTADVAAGGILLATRTGTGAAIPVEDGGPTRIVYVGGVPSGSSADQWIWSLSTIDVR